MRTYFSIGEISKMTGLTINALRHYDKIGLIRPSVVNERTNYRYYGQEQLFLFDIVLFAKRIQLPLEELSEILNSGNMQTFNDFLNEMKRRTNDKIETLRQNIIDLDNIQEEISTGQYLTDIEDLYQRNIVERDVITSAALPSHVNNRFIKQKSRLEIEIQENNLNTTFETGSIYRIIDNKVQQVSLYKGVQLEFDSESPNITHIPTGNYLCATYTEKNREEVWQKFLKALADLGLNDPLIIEQVLFNDIFDLSNRGFELQVYLSEATQE